jgi:hypothetical protein
MDLADRLDSDEYFDREEYLNVFRHLLAYWQVHSGDIQMQHFSFTAPLGLPTDELTDEDLINIRLNDEVFADWRETMAKALDVKSEEELGKLMKTGIHRLFGRRDSILCGLPMNFTFGLLGSFAARPEFGHLTDAAGAAASTGLEFLDRLLLRASRQEKAQAEVALVKHYTAFL